MGARLCVFTGLPANCKVKLYKDADPHSWVNQVPCNKEYSVYLQTHEPTFEEKYCFNAFWHNEVEVLHVGSVDGQYGNLKLHQEKNLQNMKEWYKLRKDKPTRKDKEIEKAYQAKEIIEETNRSVDDFITKRRQLWD